MYPASRHDRRTDPDDDPTGMRELLASLPGPGPMPTDLVARIEARLADEQAERGLQPGSNVAPLRTRRSGLQRLLGAVSAAAAAVVVGAIAISVANTSGGTAGGESAAVMDSGGAPVQEGAGGGRPPAGTLGAATPRAAVGSSSPSPAGAADLRATGTAYTSRDIAEQVRRVLGAPESRPAPALSAADVDRCLTALGLAGTTPSLVDLATFDGRDALVIVVAGSNSSSGPDGPDVPMVARVATPGCLSGDPTLLAQAAVP